MLSIRHITCREARGQGKREHKSHQLLDAVSECGVGEEYLQQAGHERAGPEPSSGRICLSRQLPQDPGESAWPSVVQGHGVRPQPLCQGT